MATPATLGTLELTVVSASNLAAKDRSGKSDPYFVITLTGKHTTTHQTRVVKQDLNPVWNETFKFDVMSKSDMLVLNCWDKDKLTSDDYLGTVEFGVGQFCDGLPHDKSFGLMPLKRQEEVSGDVRLRMRFVATADSDNDEMSVSDFEILKLLGRGQYGKVVQARHKKSGQVYAIKVIHKRNVVENNEVEHTKSEKQILQYLQHPFLVHLRYSFQTKHNLFLVMTFINGGELFTQLQLNDKFPDPRARFYAAEVVLALEFLHKNNIVYRDLKPENILLDADGHVVLTDFGLCKTDVDQSKGELTNTFCGTPEYLAPEVIEEQGYNQAVDWWAMGTLTYEMLTGWTPFYHEDVQRMYRKVLAGRDKVKYPEYVSASARDFVHRLLDPDPRMRLGSNGGAEEVKAHPWFAGMDWAALAKRQLPTPYKPPVNGLEDTSMFDEEFTSQMIGSLGGTPQSLANARSLSQSAQEHFDDFNWAGEGFEVAAGAIPK